MVGVGVPTTLKPLECMCAPLGLTQFVLLVLVLLMMIGSMRGWSVGVGGIGVASLLGILLRPCCGWVHGVSWRCGPWTAPEIWIAITGARGPCPVMFWGSLSVVGLLYRHKRCCWMLLSRSWVPSGPPRGWDPVASQRSSDRAARHSLPYPCACSNGGEHRPGASRDTHPAGPRSARRLNSHCSKKTISAQPFL